MSQPSDGPVSRWVIDYSTGPDLVGPFPSQDDAEEWAASYVVEYRASGGPLTLAWQTKMLTSPESLEWWSA
jgi:hypothetical protein